MHRDVVAGARACVCVRERQRHFAGFVAGVCVRERQREKEIERISGVVSKCE